MVALIQKVAVQALRTFVNHGKFQEHIHQLKLLASQITASDLNFDMSLVSNLQVYKPNAGINPITYMDLWENEVFSIGVFIVKSGASLPLHDHPGMHGIIKVIAGSIHLASYSELQDEPVPESIVSNLRPWQRHFIKPARKHPEFIASTDCDPCYLTPSDGNFHCISSVNGPAAFLDILAPPYDHDTGTRECHYYKELSPGDYGAELAELKSLPSDTCFLIRTPQPSDFYGDSVEYQGPKINPYEDLR